MRARGPIFFEHMTTLERKQDDKIKYKDLQATFNGLRRRPGYRGDAVGQVVLAGDAQQLVLRQLEAAEGTRGRLLLQLRRVRPPARKVQPMFKRSKALSAERERGSASRGTHRTIASIFFRYVGLISFRYSGLINMAAKPKAEFFRPARWHSITAEVKMGTTSTHKHNTQHTLYTLKPTQIGSHFFFKYLFFFSCSFCNWLIYWLF